jgi:acyl-coenzyme A synthetase/AMP-(fatty) acid ligase
MARSARSILAVLGMAWGYLNRPDLTAERFIDNPFSPGEKIYRTGDLAKLKPDGDIVYLGRIDHQVKVRGYRIELGEIEHNLGKQEGIKQAVVIAREDTPVSPVSGLRGLRIGPDRHPR